MDPATIAAGAMALLGPFVKKAAEEFAAEAGKEIWAKASSLLSRLKAKWAGDSFEGQTLEKFEKEPDSFQAGVESNLCKALADDPDLARELAAIIADVKKAGPKVKIVQTIETAEAAVTGPHIDEINRGSVSAEQRIGTSKAPVTGPRIGRIG